MSLSRPACTTSVSLLTAACLIALPAQAGRGCDELPARPDQLQHALSLALKVRTRLETTQQQVVIVARVGRDMSKYGLRYSHAALAWRDHPQGRWLVVHELNECQSDRSNLYNEGLGNVFLDVVENEALLLTLPAPLQARLAERLRHPGRMHEARYNVVAYPFSTRYQNSNQWLLETLAGALDDTGRLNNRQAAQEWLKVRGYQPSVIRLRTFSRLGGRLFNENVAFDDHPTNKRLAGKIAVVTVESIAEFLQAQQSLISREVIRLE